MLSMLENFSELENDAVVEVFNIGIGRAASALNKMVSEMVTLSIPTVDVVPRSEAIVLIEQQVDTVVTAVSQNFEGDFEGSAILMFPQEQSLSLVRALLNDDLTLDKLTELEQEALKEVGNIILNACFGTVTNMLNLEVTISTPEFRVGSPENVIPSDNSQSEWALYMQVCFELVDSDIQGYVTFLMGINAVNHFKQGITAYVNKLTSGGSLNSSASQ